MRWILLSTIALIISLFLVLWFFGFQFYIASVLNINSQEISDRLTSREYFNVDDDTITRGIISKTYFNSPNKSILVWVRFKPRIFKIDNDTFYSLYKTCDANVYNKLDGGGDEITLDDRQIFTDIDLWSAQIQQGDFVEIIKDKNKLVEIRAYDSWWPFSPILFNKNICEK